MSISPMERAVPIDESNSPRAAPLVQLRSPPLRIDDIVWIEFEILMLSPEYSDLWPRRSPSGCPEYTTPLVNAIYRIGCERFLRTRRDHLVELGFLPEGWEPTAQSLDDLFFKNLSPWHHQDLRQALGAGATAVPRLLAIQEALFTARRQLLDRWKSSEGLLIGLRRAAVRAGSSDGQFASWTEDDVYSELFTRIADHPNLLYVDERGIRRIDFDELYDLLRDRRKRLPVQDSHSEEGERGLEEDVVDPNISGLTATVSREVREALDRLRASSPLSAAALESLEGAERPELARRYGTTVDRIRGEEARLVARLRREFGANPANDTVR